MPMNSHNSKTAKSMLKVTTTDSMGYHKNPFNNDLLTFIIAELMVQYNFGAIPRKLESGTNTLFHDEEKCLWFLSSLLIKLYLYYSTTFLLKLKKKKEEIL